MKTIYAKFDNHENARKAAGALMDHGVDKAHFNMVINSDEKTQRKYKDSVDGVTTTTAADAAEGAKTGVVAGAAIGALAGLASLFIPGFGLVIGGGALATAAGAAVGTAAAGAAAGGVTGYLKDQGIEEPIAQDFEETLEKGGALISLTLPSNDVTEAEARSILSKYRSGTIVESSKAIVAN